ncbi:hypothetical protein CLV35_0690 [Motilibacter peucedani]|uniref:TetR family transcriptional regulator n=1 Tax=Motilibacter peucedani TaxID=598650 RepID=A0A420XTV5_9ACTN|nr:hypothetical protein [Motilibacter peucedani]RKS80265.1 hypothetical protein CLV35_0690 [Motilibacter peucedani]
MRTSGRLGDGYVEGERVFAPPQGSFDADWVASLAAEQLARPVARPAVLAAVADAWAAIRLGALGSNDLLEGDHEPDVAAAAVSAAREFITAYDVPVHPPVTR